MGLRTGRGGETNWVSTERNRRFDLMFRILRSDQSAVDKAWTLPNAARKWRQHKVSEGCDNQ